MTKKSNQVIKNLSNSTPRKNLPHSTSGKRTESILTILFVEILKTQLELRNKRYLLSRELDLNGYGIADLILFEYKIEKDSTKTFLKKSKVIGFEIKIKDWRKAMIQAFRYRYYSDKSIVVLPQENIKGAIKNINIFKMLGIGLWAVDKNNNVVIKYYTPRLQKPINKKANEKALSIIKSNFKFLQSF